MLIEREFNIIDLNSIEIELLDTFNDTFKKNGYTKHKSKKSLISSEDHSVRFIGSTTNVFKKYLTKDVDISDDGFYLVQKCLRTRNTSVLFDDNNIPIWSSYFTAMGIISPSGNLDKVVKDTIEFILKLGIECSRIKLNVSSQDLDLLKCLKKYQVELGYLIEVDGQSNINYYRHTYGMKDVFGRNFNISINYNERKIFKDIGNIVLIERQKIPIAVEMGIGVSTLISKIFGLNNSIESSSISKIIPFKKGIISKFADAISTSVVMMREGVKPGSRDKPRLLRTNLYSISYFRKKLDIDLEKIKQYINDYEKEEFGEVTIVSNNVIDYLNIYEEIK